MHINLTARIQIPINKSDKTDYLDKNDIWKIGQKATNSSFEPNEQYMRTVSLRVAMKKLKAIELLTGMKFDVNTESIEHNV